MVYNSFSFLIVYPLIFLLYYLIPRRFQSLRTWFLLIVSYVLYISWSPYFAIVLLGVSLVTFWGGLLIWKQKEEKRRKQVTWLLTLLGLLPLLLFKYYNFLNDNIIAGLTAIGCRIVLPGLNWAVPIGISFFTFQAVGYMLDVYHLRIEPEKKHCALSAICVVLPIYSFWSYQQGLPDITTDKKASAIF